MILDRVPCIHYLMQFPKSKGATIQALIDLGSEVNIMTPAYAKQLGLQVQKTDIRAQKIDNLLLRTFRMVIAGFQVEDKLDRAHFFQESFLVANISMKVVLGMPFLTFSNVDIQFAKKELTWRSYTVAEALPTTKWVDLIDKKEFAKGVLDEEFKTFVVHVALLEILSRSTKMKMHPSQAAQIATLKQDEALTKVSSKYADYTNVFLFDLVMELPENTGINEHAIKLEKEKQPLYRPIYSLEPVELGTLKTYIKIHLKTGFIQPSKSSINTLILFDKKPNGSFWLYVNY